MIKVIAWMIVAIVGMIRSDPVDIAKRSSAMLVAIVGVIKVIDALSQTITWTIAAIMAVITAIVRVLKMNERLTHSCVHTIDA
jgi:uncharacterized membrane protein